VKKFGLDESRYDDFSYLCFMDLDDIYVQNYVDFQLGKAEPIIKGRIAMHKNFWIGLGTPDWLLDLLTNGEKYLLIKIHQELFYQIIGQL